MSEIITTFVYPFWDTLSQMAPYLLFGFLAAGLLSVFISARSIERHLGGSGRWPIPKAALLGVPLPLCSCSVLPVSASLHKHGASSGSVLAFLISTPQTGVDCILVTFALLGPLFAVVRPVVALASGLAGGLVARRVDGTAGATGPKQSVEPECCHEVCCEHENQGGRLRRALAHGFGKLPGDIGGALLVGIGVAGLITILVPDGFFMGIGTGIVSILVMMVIGIPLYVCSAASVPIAAALILRGVSPGAALAFLITGPATNAAAIATVWRLLGARIATVYLGTVALTALLSGLGLNAIVGMVGGTEAIMEHAGHTMLPPSLRTASALLLLLVIGLAMFRRTRERRAVAERAVA